MTHIVWYVSATNRKLQGWGSADAVTLHYPHLRRRRLGIVPDGCEVDLPDGTLCGISVYDKGVCALHHPGEVSPTDQRSALRKFLSDRDETDAVECIRCYDFKLHNAEIPADIGLSKPVKFIECEFRNGLRLSALVCEELTFEECKFDSLAVVECQLPSFELRDCIFHGDRGMRIYDSAIHDVDIEDCTLNGNFHIGNSLVYSLNAEDHTFQERFSVMENVFWHLNLRYSTFEEDIIFRNNRVRVEINLSQSEVQKTLVMQSSEIYLCRMAEMELYQAKMEDCDFAYLYLIEATVGGDVKIVACDAYWAGFLETEVRERLQIRDLTVREDLREPPNPWLSIEHAVPGRDFIRSVTMFEKGLPFMEQAHVDLRRLDIPDAGRVELIGRQADLDLSGFLFLHTDVRDLLFERVRWAGDGRNQVFDEVVLRERLHEDSGRVSPRHVAELYRRLRVNYENALRYDQAGDFYVGEKDMERLAREPQQTRKGWLKRNGSLLGLYNLFARYGQSPSRVGFWIVGLYALLLMREAWSEITTLTLTTVGLWDALGSALYVLLNVPPDATPVDRLFGVMGLFFFGLLFVTLRQKLMRPSQVAP